MFGLARSARKIGIAQWGPRTSLRQPSALGGRRRDRAGNARGRSLGSIPSLTWSAHETEAAERRIDNDHTSKPNRGGAGLERAQVELRIIELQLRLRGLLE
jgi:hypothetical protein